jgi:hypothetical protein
MLRLWYDHTYNRLFARQSGSAVGEQAAFVGSHRSKARFGQSIYPNCLHGLSACRRPSLLDRIGELNAGHAETFDHNSRHAKAQSLLLRISNETSQCHYVSFHRHKLISHQQYGFEAITRLSILSAEPAAA